jgi:hypothetical protein
MALKVNLNLYRVQPGARDKYIEHQIVLQYVIRDFITFHSKAFVTSPKTQIV